MPRVKILLIFAMLFFINTAAFAVVEAPASKQCYPDYAYEFTGRDKCESFNRKLFIFNMKLNKYVLRPVNIVWASIMPKYGMDRIKCVYTNINFPTRFVSCILQKDFKTLKHEAKRFAINTTMGVGGLYDVAQTKFKMEPRQEDMQQALAHYDKRIKKGPYLFLPIIHGNLRDDIGQVMNYPLNPCAYVLGPFSIVATAAFFINNSTYLQPLIKKVELTYADPYELIRAADGVTNYIKNNNLDRTEVFAQTTAKENIVPINNVADCPELKPDVRFSDFNLQSPLIDAMRTTLFDNMERDNSKWAEISLWNKSFDKQIKTASVRIYDGRPKYKYRYILQTDKNAPVAIIFPSIGEGILSDKSVMQTKMLYREGYSVIMLGSTCNWEFLKSMPTDYRPGLPNVDAQYLRTATARILEDVQSKYRCNFRNKIAVGTSFGAITGLFVAAQESEENTLNISRYISINPPVEAIFAINQVDKFSQDWKNDSSDIKARAAITVQRVLQKTQEVSDKNGNSNPTYFPFSDDEAKLILGFFMRQKLYDLVFTIENGSRAKKNKIYTSMNDMSFNDYAQKYLFANQTKSIAQLDYEASLYSIASYLKSSDNYKIYHSVDDYYASPQQLAWLKQQSGEKVVYFSNGSHLGELYRPEFIAEFKKEIHFKNEQTDKIEPTLVKEAPPTHELTVKPSDKPILRTAEQPVSIKQEIEN